MVSVRVRVRVMVSVSVGVRVSVRVRVRVRVKRVMVSQLNKKGGAAAAIRSLVGVEDVLLGFGLG